jgi:kynurenine formamidase
MKSKFIDLSHTIEDGLVTYKGLPAPIICDYLSREKSRDFYEKGTEFQIGKIEMVANTGTYLDSPFHRYKNGKDISQLSLSGLVDINTVVIRAPYYRTLALTENHFKGYRIKNHAVLIHTGWSKYWKKDEYFENHPYLTEGAALYLKKKGALLVGIDSYNIDNTKSKKRPVHSILLKHEILIIEHLCNLDKLPQEGTRLTVVPPKIEGMGTFPVRAFAKIC